MTKIHGINMLLEDSIELCIKSLLEKFLKWPHNFFTESDAHSYLYYYFFRYGSRAIKQLYPTKDNKKTVLIHREYPTSFRYSKKIMQLNETKGGRGHYDLSVLNPDFVRTHDLAEVIAKDYRKCAKDWFPHLIAAVEFKLIINPLDKNMRDEIEKDFQKLSWAIEQNQAKHAYMIIFNRSRAERNFKEQIRKKEIPSRLKGIYIESIVGTARHYDIIYLGDWRHKLRYDKRSLYKGN